METVKDTENEKWVKKIQGRHAYLGEYLWCLPVLGPQMMGSSHRNRHWQVQVFAARGFSEKGIKSINDSSLWHPFDDRTQQYTGMRMNSDNSKLWSLARDTNSTLDIHHYNFFGTRHPCIHLMFNVPSVDRRHIRYNQSWQV